MRLKQFLIIACIALESCCFSTKNITIGENIKVSEFSVVDVEIMYCFDECCDTGLGIIPQTLVAYGFNEKWIIAKNDSSYNGRGGKFAYWIFNKNISPSNLGASIKSNLIGPLDSLSFYRTLTEKNIQLKLTKYPR